VILLPLARAALRDCDDRALEIQVAPQLNSLNPLHPAELKQATTPGDD